MKLAIGLLFCAILELASPRTIEVPTTEIILADENEDNTTPNFGILEDVVFREETSNQNETAFTTDSTSLVNTIYPETSTKPMFLLSGKDQSSANEMNVIFRQEEGGEGSGPQGGEAVGGEPEGAEEAGSDPEGIPTGLEGTFPQQQPDVEGFPVQPESESGFETDQSQEEDEEEEEEEEQEKGSTSTSARPSTEKGQGKPNVLPEQGISPTPLQPQKVGAENISSNKFPNQSQSIHEKEGEGLNLIKPTKASTTEKPAEDEVDSEIVSEAAVEITPSTTSPRPTIQGVQDGNFPFLEPGIYTKRTPKPTETTSHPETVNPIFLPAEVTPGIPVEGIVDYYNENEKLPILEQATGKYKITKPKTPSSTITDQSPTSPGNAAAITVSTTPSFNNEWNITSSIFRLTPQGRADCECGKTPYKVSSGGGPGGVNEYPWTAAIVRVGIFGGGRPHCGGVLINNQYVLSSASCFDQLYTEGIQVWLTAHNSLQSIDNIVHSDRVIKRDVREILMHPNFDRRNHDNDIALLKLSYPINISTSSYYVPACLPASMNTYEGMNARVMGWSSSSNRRYPNQMCKEDLPVISNAVCNRDSTHRNKVTGNQLCAGYLVKQPIDSCIGDAGGPLMIPNNGHYTLIGLVSYGYSNRAAYTPTVYTRVGSYADWILHNTQDADWCSL